MHRLLAPVAGVEAGDKCSQVVLVHRLVQPSTTSAAAFTSALIALWSPPSFECAVEPARPCTHLSRLLRNPLYIYLLHIPTHGP